MTDDRVTCAMCSKLNHGWCTDAKRAGLAQSQRLEVGRDLAELPQHCPAFRMSDLICTRCGMTGHRASQCKRSIPARAHSEAAA